MGGRDNDPSSFPLIPPQPKFVRIMAFHSWNMPRYHHSLDVLSLGNFEIRHNRHDSSFSPSFRAKFRKKILSICLSPRCAFGPGTMRFHGIQPAYRLCAFLRSTYLHACDRAFVLWSSSQPTGPASCCSQRAFLRRARRIFISFTIMKVFFVDLSNGF
jgi:hypothetical protein